MKSFETIATVESDGEIQLSGVPFSPGTEVDVTVCPKRRSAEEFLSGWERVCRELHSLPHLQAITEEEIEQEVADYRAGR